MRTNITKTAIWQLASLGLATLFTLSCADSSPGSEEQNPSSSSSVAPSSSSVVPSSSSVVPSSSSSTPPSSSSSAGSSSSSSQPGSSSSEPSSSSVTPSSSSVAPSSSSVVPSSSSVAPSSSSRPSITYGSVTYEGQAYKTVQIGTQNWMAENLDYDVAGSKCYSNSESNCATYGRLYNWSTAMDLPSSCNSSTCASQVSAKHRGICPSGWHIPSDADWNVLIKFIHEDNGLGSFTSGTSSYAGRYLKSVTGWNSYSGIVNEDTYGFAALPGGFGYSGGDFGGAGLYGFWWSSSEGNAYDAYHRYMFHNYEYANWFNDDKAYLFSVRCLQD